MLKGDWNNCGKQEQSLSIYCIQYSSLFAVVICVQGPTVLKMFEKSRGHITGENNFV